VLILWKKVSAISAIIWPIFSQTHLNKNNLFMFNKIPGGVRRFPECSEAKQIFRPEPADLKQGLKFKACLHVNNKIFSRNAVRHGTVSVRLTTFRQTSFCLTTFHLTTFWIMTFHLTMFCLTMFHLMMFCVTMFRLTMFCLMAFCVTTFV
jgi:hypothetical protein